MAASRRTGLYRRTLLRASALGLAGAALSPWPDLARAAGRRDPLPLSVAGYKFRRTEALADGRVGVEGCRMAFAEQGIGDLNTHVFSGPQTLDVTEIGLHPFMLAYANDGFRDYTLLPIFPLRLFRHKSVFIRSDRGIEKPQDLRGKTVATAGYSSTSLTWLRGIFEDEYGVRPEDVRWVVATADSSADVAGKVSAQERVLPDGVSITAGPPGRDESELLAAGDVDAVFHAAEPRAYIDGHPQVARLFPDYRSAERAYFANTGIFPIMHAVAIRSDLVERNPWLARAVFDAYSEAKRLSFEHMRKLAWVYDSLPWYGQEFDETRALMGGNYYSYGLPPNREALETLCRYSYRQGLSRRRLAVDELFAPGSLELLES